MDKKRNMIIAGILKEAVELSYDIKVPSDIDILKNAFTRSGYDLYLVGGAVRDSLLKKKPKDFDLATNAKPEEVQNVLNRFKIHNFPKGEQFGVISAMIDGEEYEIATFRKEEYDGSGRRPVNVEYSGIDEDAIRRDLTINALYYDLDKKKVIDLVGGIEDIKNKRVRTVGEPEEIMFQDRLRVMRAIRFKNVIGGELDLATQKAIVKYKHMPGVSNERVRDEFYSILKKSVDPAVALKDLQGYGMFDRMFPGASITPNFINGLRHPVLVIALLLKNNDAKFVHKMMTEMKYTNEEKAAVRLLLKFLQLFENFDPVHFSVDAEAKAFNNLLNHRKSGLNKTNKAGEVIMDDNDFINFMKINGISEDFSKKFLSLENRSTADIPEIQDKIASGELPSSGKELGDARERIILGDFLQSL